jgi:hypothetical protein
MSKEQVVQWVQERLRDRHPGGVDLSVVESGVRCKDDYWYVPVQPSAQPPRTFEYYEVLADVETELSEHERLNVWLVPTLPEEPDPLPAASH